MRGSGYNDIKRIGNWKNAVILSVGGEGRAAAALFGYGTDPGRGSDHGKICAMGGSAGTENPRCELTPGRGREKIEIREAAIHSEKAAAHKPKRDI